MINPFDNAQFRRKMRGERPFCWAPTLAPTGRARQEHEEHDPQRPHVRGEDVEGTLAVPQFGRHKRLPRQASSFAREGTRRRSLRVVAIEEIGSDGIALTAIEVDDDGYVSLNAAIVFSK